MAPPLEDPLGRGESSLVGVPPFKLTACQEPDQWETETDDEDETEQSVEVLIISITLEASSELPFS